MWENLGLPIFKGIISQYIFECRLGCFGKQQYYISFSHKVCEESCPIREAKQDINYVIHTNGFLICLYPKGLRYKISINSMISMVLFKGFL